VASGGTGLGGHQIRLLESRHLMLAPLRVADAQDMFDVLNDARLNAYIGGEPPHSVDELRTRYERLVSGSGRPHEVWMNWIVRRRCDGAAIGTVQATITKKDELRAEVAWIIGVPWQGRGYASEAAAVAIRWLRQQGILRVHAYIHPDHRASMAVARHLGMQPAAVRHDGETRWDLPSANDMPEGGNAGTPL
jgi:RimJ/RimL family protein N-acetyltransferase